MPEHLLLRAIHLRISAPCFLLVVVHLAQEPPLPSHCLVLEKPKKSARLSFNLLKGKSSKIVIQVNFIPLMLHGELHPPKANDEPLVSHAVLAVFLYEVQSIGARKPFISMEASGGPASTSTVGRSNENYEYGEYFLFPIHDVQTDKVSISLLDEMNSLDTIPPRRISKIRRFKFENRNNAHNTDKQSTEHEQYVLLGRKSLNLEDFTGFKQIVELESDPRETHKVVVAGKLHYLERPRQPLISGKT